MYSLYLVTNLINNKIYIGQTKNFKQRLSQYRSAFNRKYNKQLLHKAFVKYGFANFKFEVIAMAKNLEDANEAEKDLIRQYNSDNFLIGYNVSSGGTNFEKNEAIRNNISKGLRNHYANNVSILKGKPQPQWLREKISKGSMGKPGTNKGKKFSEQWRKNISKSLTGFKHSEETRKNMSMAHIGNIAPNRKLNFDIAEEIRLKYRNGLTQKQLSIEYGVSQDTIFNIVHFYTYKK